MTELRDRDLVRLYWPVELRPAFDALFAIDDAMADVVEKATDPTLAAIKLAWWRDRLEGLDRGEVPAEPRLQAATSELLSRGLAGATLALLERSWAEALVEKPDEALLIERGALLFQMGARLLDWDGHSAEIAPLGRLFGSAHLRRRGLLLQPVEGVATFKRAPTALRPVTSLAALAMRDLRRSQSGFEPEATPGRAFALLRHRLTGRIS